MLLIVFSGTTHSPQLLLLCNTEEQGSPQEAKAAHNTAAQILSSAILVTTRTKFKASQDGQRVLFCSLKIIYEHKI